MHKKHELIIVGASGFGKEVLLIARRLGMTVKGFLDDTPDKQDSVINGVPVLGGINMWPLYSECRFVVAVGSPKARRVIVTEMYHSGVPEYVSLIDPMAIIGENIDIGIGTVICAGVICTVDVKIGNHVIINLNSTVGHDAVLGDYCTVAPLVGISGNVYIKSGSEIGTGASLREKITLNENCLVGMGSVVVKDVGSDVIAFGNPAKHRLKNVD